MQKAIHTTSAKAEMTFPSVVRDLFMFAPSWNRKQEQLCELPFKKI